MVQATEELQVEDPDKNYEEEHISAINTYEEEWLLSTESSDGKQNHPELKIPYLNATIYNTDVVAYIDSGATISLVSNKLISNKELEIRRYSNIVRDVSGNKIPIIGTVTAIISTPDGNIKEQLLVYKKDKDMKIDLLLGMNILKRTSIDFLEKKIYFNHD